MKVEQCSPDLTIPDKLLPEEGVYINTCEVNRSGNEIAKITSKNTDAEKPLRNAKPKRTKNKIKAKESLKARYKQIEGVSLG